MNKIIECPTKKYLEHLKLQKVNFKSICIKHCPEAILIKKYPINYVNFNGCIGLICYNGGGK